VANAPKVSADSRGIVSQLCAVVCGLDFFFFFFFFFFLGTYARNIHSFFKSSFETFLTIHFSCFSCLVFFFCFFFFLFSFFFSFVFFFFFFSFFSFLFFFFFFCASASVLLLLLLTLFLLLLIGSFLFFFFSAFAASSFLLPSSFSSLCRSGQVMADIVEAVTGAVFIDCGYDWSQTGAFARRMCSPIWDLTVPPPLEPCRQLQVSVVCLLSDCLTD
jgi:hypothetical protein